MTRQALTSALAVLLVCLSPRSARAQGSAGSDAAIQPRFLVDLPTAGIIPHGNIALDMEFYRAGGLLVGASLGAFDRLLFGVSYGGVGLIGPESPSWDPSPGVQVRARIINESVVFPAIALGFDTQGKEAYVDRLHRYTVKSRGFYAVASKNYNALGFLSIHGGVNYSLERDDGDEDPDLFAGMEKTVGPFLSLLVEYDLGLNDSHNQALGRGRGYLNMAARISLGKGLTLGINLKDLMRNQQDISIADRTIALEYVQSL